MSFFLRLIGITNAAIWLGSALFFTAGVWPAFFSADMQKILPPSHAGAAALVVMGRYFALQYWCGAIALGHLLTEWLYAGKPFRRGRSVLVGGLLALGLLSGLYAAPRLQRLHLEEYGIRSTPQQRMLAGNATRFWQAFIHLSNLVGLIGLWVYTWEMSQGESSARFVSPAKLRG